MEIKETANVLLKLIFTVGNENNLKGIHLQKKILTITYNVLILILTFQITFLTILLWK